MTIASVTIVDTNILYKNILKSDTKESFKYDKLILTLGEIFSSRCLFYFCDAVWLSWWVDENVICLSAPDFLSPFIGFELQVLRHWALSCF